MEEYLDKIDKMIDASSNIPDNIRSIVKAICKGYVRESNGLIPLQGIMNVCNTIFEEVNENMTEFQGENRILGSTETDYDISCHVIHRMSYINDPDKVKLIAILTHELGHVITEYAPFQIGDNGIYSLAKRTNTLYFDIGYDLDHNLLCEEMYGFRMADGFLESISTRIWQSKSFRDELSASGYDLGDYVYKDERLFPSRVYDEYKACFELFDYILDGKLFTFSCLPYQNNSEIVKEINDNRLKIIYEITDKSNDALWQLKKYEGQESDNTFMELFQNYKEAKEGTTNLVYALMEFLGKDINDSTFKDLLATYEDAIKRQKLLPIPSTNKEY